MDITQVLVKAYITEAKSKPTHMIKIGGKFMTFAAFAELLETKINNDSSVKRFLSDATKMFNENAMFKAHMMSLAGVDHIE